MGGRTKPDPYHERVNPFTTWYDNDRLLIRCRCDGGLTSALRFRDVAFDVCEPDVRVAVGRGPPVAARGAGLAGNVAIVSPHRAGVTYAKPFSCAGVVVLKQRRVILAPDAIDRVAQQEQDTMAMFSHATLCGAFAPLVMRFGVTEGAAEAACRHDGNRTAGRSQAMTFGRRMMPRHSRVPLVAAIVLPGAAVAFVALAGLGVPSLVASHSAAGSQGPLGASYASAAVAAPATMEIVPARVDGRDAGLFVGTGDQSNGSGIQW
jgi:hypothetical protein